MKCYTGEFCALAEYLFILSIRDTNTLLMRLDFSLKFTSPTSTLCPVATLAAEGMEKSRRVFSAMGSVIVDGDWEAGSLADCKIGGGMT